MTGKPDKPLSVSFGEKLRQVAIGVVLNFLLETKPSRQAQYALSRGVKD
jgi:hypothetical protein